MCADSLSCSHTVAQQRTLSGAAQLNKQASLSRFMPQALIQITCHSSRAAPFLHTVSLPGDRHCNIKHNSSSRPQIGAACAVRMGAQGHDKLLFAQHHAQDAPGTNQQLQLGRHTICISHFILKPCIHIRVLFTCHTLMLMPLHSSVAGDANKADRPAAGALVQQQQQAAAPHQQNPKPQKEQHQHQAQQVSRVLPKNGSQQCLAWCTSNGAVLLSAARQEPSHQQCHSGCRGPPRGRRLSPL